MSILAAFGDDDGWLDHATDDELAQIIEAARAELVQLDTEWVLNARQRDAERLANSGDVFELLYGGAAGGGKSEWLLYHHYHLAQKFPKFHGLLLRRTFPELRRSLIMRSWERFDTKLGKYYASEHIWRFKNGSSIEFGYVEADKDVYQYQSAEYDCIGFDELTQFPTDFCYTYLMSRCRTTVDKRARGLVPHVVAGTNPGGVGGAWVKERYVDIGPPNTVYQSEVVIRGQVKLVPRIFVPAKLSDNPYLGTEYEMALANLNDATRAALMDGSWDVVEGQYFTEWDRSVHVVDPFEIPRTWPRIRGIDYGYTAPMCCLWGAVDLDGGVWIYRELYGPGMTPTMQAKEILAMSRYGLATGSGSFERIDYTIADPSVWTKTGAGPPIASQYRDAGLICRKANNARVDGWARVRDFLRVDPEMGPKLHVFSTCSNLIRTFPMLVHAKVNPEDLDTRGEDHAGDALRYLLMSRPSPARAAKRPAATTPDGRHWEGVRSRLGRRRQTSTDESPVGRLN